MDMYVLTFGVYLLLFVVSSVAIRSIPTDRNDD